MAINQITSSYTGTEDLFGNTTQTAQKEDPLGRDAFLRMLVAQLRHQDPLNPMDGTDFTAQLAQFSSLEQMFNMNSSLKAIQGALETQKEEENYMDYIGKEVVSLENALTVTNGKASGGAYTIAEPAEIMVSVYDSNGKEVRQIYPGYKTPGTHEIKWDGVDSSGNVVKDGVYTFTVKAIGDGGVSIPATTSVTGEVTGVAYVNGLPYIQVGTLLIDPSTVVVVRTPTAA